MAKKGVCKQCNVVISWSDKHVHFLDTFCPMCGKKLSRYNNMKSWKLKHIVVKAMDVEGAIHSGPDTV